MFPPQAGVINLDGQATGWPVASRVYMANISLCLRRRAALETPPTGAPGSVGQVGLRQANKERCQQSCLQPQRIGDSSGTQHRRPRMLRGSLRLSG